MKVVLVEASARLASNGSLPLQRSFREKKHFALSEFQRSWKHLNTSNPNVDMVDLTYWRLAMVWQLSIQEQFGNVVDSSSASKGCGRTASIIHLLPIAIRPRMVLIKGRQRGGAGANARRVLRRFLGVVQVFHTSASMERMGFEACSFCLRSA